MITRLVMLGALLAPSLAVAQPTPNDPNAPAPTEVPPPPPPEAPPAPDTLPPPDAPTEQAPAVIVNTTPVIVQPPEYRVVDDSYNAPVLATGVLVFAATYGASVVTAATTDDQRGNNRLYIPIVGPWLALNDRGSCGILKSSCDHETTAKVLLIADGVFQAAGVIAMLDGLLQPSQHSEYVASAKVDTKTRVRPTMVTSVGGSAPGIAVLGRF